MSNLIDEKEYWDRVFFREDPWNYLSTYEQKKYAHTLELLPEEHISHALELGCAEGIFTEKLSDHVDELLAVDISQRALERARKRYQGKPGIRFAQHDIANGLPEGVFDLIVCSEIIYYLRDKHAVELFATQLKEALAVGGHLLMTHANMVSDDRTQTGFDFNEIGAKFIGDIFSSEPGLEFTRELRTELYRVQLFKRIQYSEDTPPTVQLRAPKPPMRVVQREAKFEHPAIKRGGCVVTSSEARHCWISTEIPILMYHRIADSGPGELAPYRVSTKLFEQQLVHLQRHGFSSISMGEFHKTWFKEGVPFLPGKPIILTFDDAYLDFYENAWPLLRKYGFNATVFVPVNFVDGYAEWDSEFGEPAKIMNWDQINELNKQGVSFGSHSCCHRRLAEMSENEVYEDAKKSKEILKQKLGVEVFDYCYPYAAASKKMQQTIATAGYRMAVGGTGGDPADKRNVFYIRRIEIFGSDGMDEFVAKLPAPTLAPLAQRLEYHQLRMLRDRSTYMGR